MKKRIIIFIIIIFIIITIFFMKNDYKIFRTGNNINIKSADEIKEYVLNISSYQAEATVSIISNKTTNIYVVRQQYDKKENTYKQELLEPKNVARNNNYL